MTYNVHPIFVHFPIALLFIYSIVKILPLQKWFPNVAWRQIERFLLLFGVLGAFAALETGSIAEHLVHPNRQLVDMHSFFGSLSTWLYGALLLGEMAAVANGMRFMQQKSFEILLSVCKLAEKILCNKWLSGIVAFIGLIAISLTGLLGGVIAYGLTADPVAAFVVKALGINL